MTDSDVDAAAAGREDYSQSEERIELIALWC